MSRAPAPAPSVLASRGGCEARRCDRGPFVEPRAQPPESLPEVLGPPRELPLGARPVPGPRVPADREGRDVVAETAAPGHALGGVDRIAVTLLSHAHHHVTDEAGIDLGVLDRRLDRHATELSGGEPGEEHGFLVVHQNVRPRRASAAVEDHDALTIEERVQGIRARRGEVFAAQRLSSGSSRYH